MADEKMIRLIKLLYEKTMSGDLRWEATVESNSFVVSFKDYSVTLFTRRNRENSDYVDFHIAIINNEGEEIEQAADTDFNDYKEQPDVYAMLSATYNRARRSALGVDVALDRLLSELGA